MLPSSSDNFYLSFVISAEGKEYRCGGTLINRRYVLTGTKFSSAINFVRF